MYARSDIARTAIAKSTGRNPGAAEELVFTSTGNTVAAIWLRAKKPPYHWRTETEHGGLGACGLSIGEHAGLVWDTSFELVSWIEAIATSRKILCTGALIGASLATVAAPPSPRQPRRRVPVRARLSQAGRRLIFSLRTSKPVALAQAQPAAGRRRLVLTSASSCEPSGQRRRAAALPRRRARAPRGGSGSSCSTPPGSDRQGRRVPATAQAPAARQARPRPAPRRRRASPRSATAGASSPAGAAAAPGARGACEASLPASGTRLFRLRPVRAVGCTGGSAGLVTNGPRDRKVVALTFDDGPSEYTPDFLAGAARKARPRDLLRDRPGDAAAAKTTMRQILARRRARSATTRCTTSNSPATAQIAGAAARIESTTPTSGPASSGRPAARSTPR